MEPVGDLSNGSAGPGVNDQKESAKRVRAVMTRKIGAAAIDEADELRKLESAEANRPQGIMFRCSHPNCNATQPRAGQCEKCARAPVRLISNRAQNQRVRSII